MTVTSSATWKLRDYAEADADDDRELGVLVSHLGFVTALPLAVARIDAPLDGASGLVGDGWFDADAEDTRWTRPEAEARLTVPADHSLHLLHLGVEAGPVATTLQVWVNDQIVGRIPLAAHNRASVRLVLPESMAGNLVHIRLLADTTWTPSAFGSPDDHRELGVLMRELGITTVAPPAVARIDAPLDGTGGLLGDGWSGPDAEGTRWTGAEAEAWLTVPAGSGASQLCVAATAGPIPTTFQVWVDNQAVRQVRLGPNQQATLRQPLPEETAGTVIRIHVGATPTWVPAEFGYVGDHRTLGMRVKALAVIDQSSDEACPAKPNPPAGP